MPKLHRLALPLLLSAIVAASISPVAFAETETAAAGQTVAKYLLHVDGMT